ncbi:hypothetical protein Q0M94_05980 [Deinococcus radiomollis]|uniref:hypothetical protein n=1 Tax=Deinococcus radiomollis TaxID=468916 RepID=UPI003892202C
MKTAPAPTSLTEFEQGLLLGILIGEGHFGGDGKQAQITLRMHTRSLKVFQLLVRLFPASKLYGPYEHGGRSYYQWMARGEVLREVLVPLLDTLPMAEIDEHVYGRYLDMKSRYGL